MPARRWCALVIATATLCAPAIVAGGEAAADAPTSDRWVGVDGKVYQDAPITVPGLPESGQVFFGWDFNHACYVGLQIEHNLDQLRRLTRIIEKSGRRAYFAIGPNKASALSRDLDLTKLPHGDCDLEGLDAQDNILDYYQSRNFVKLRKKLSTDPRQVYWKTDGHWTSIGGSVFAKTLAHKLSPALAKRQQYTQTEKTMLGNLNDLAGKTETETAPALVPTDFVHVETTKGVDPDEGITTDLSWKTTPAKKTWPGKTLLIGDSFAFVALGTLRPLFNKGRFMWLVHSDINAVTRAMMRSDTVVIELVQWSLALVDNKIPELTTSFKAAAKAEMKKK